MKEREIIKIDQTQPQDFNFRPKNHWRRLPWYFLLAIMAVIVIICGGLYYQTKMAAKQIITKNESPPPNALGQVSGVNLVPKLEEDPYRGLVNILLLGNGGANHPGGGLTDVIQVLSIDPKKKKALIFSVPRDLYVDVKGFGWHKINTAYVFGEKNGHGEGGKLAKKEVEEVLGMPIHYYLKIDFIGFVKLINLLGGVEVCVDQSINDPQHQTYVGIGCQHMDGQATLAYVRSRYSSSDFDRSRRQQKVMMAVKDKALKLGFFLNPLKINQALNILAGNFNTDIQLSEIKKLSLVFRELNPSQVSNYVLDNRKDGLLYSAIKDGAYILSPYGGDFKKIHHFVKKRLP